MEFNHMFTIILIVLAIFTIGSVSASNEIISHDASVIDDLSIKDSTNNDLNLKSIENNDLKLKNIENNDLNLKNIERNDLNLKSIENNDLNLKSIENNDLNLESARNNEAIGLEDNGEDEICSQADSNMETLENNGMGSNSNTAQEDLNFGNTLKASNNGNAQNSHSSKASRKIKSKTRIIIGNARLLSNGYLRIYLKSNSKKAISKKRVEIRVKGKKFIKTTNSEGMIIFKPNVKKGKAIVTVKFNGDAYGLSSKAKKIIRCINGSVQNPLTSSVPLRNGIPDIDMMPANFVLADGNGNYTLTRLQYREAIKRDSYCLFLNNHLSRYTFFSTKSHPKLHYIIPRKKWNVIERAINTIVVKKNRKYWPKEITVSLKGKSYTYSEVRDEQNLIYSCGPTSCSMCSQALRNYISESQLVKLSHARKGYGSHPDNLSKAMGKNHFICTQYYKEDFNIALKELKKGGCALVFHTWGHYLAILDISKDGKKLLISNSRGTYNGGIDKMPTKWLRTKYVKSRFANDTPGLIVRLNYRLSKKNKNQVNNFYSSMGPNWRRQNTRERIPQIGL